MMRTIFSARYRPVLDAIFAALALIAMWLWGWRTQWNEVPSYGDTLEVLWGIEWYAKSLSSGSSPFFYSAAFHPNGWHVATLAHTPLMFLLAQPFYLLGGAAFAYNAVAFLAIVVGYWGTYNLMRTRSGVFVSIIAALVFAFAPFRWIRADGGHLHFLLASSLLPWFVQNIEMERDTSSHRALLLAGVTWGAMINFSFYFIFIAAIPLLLLGFRRYRSILAIILIAFACAAPVLILFYFGRQADQLGGYSLSTLLAWGASPQTFVMPASLHPFPVVRQLAVAAYSGIVNEVSQSNWGPVLWTLGIIALFREWRLGQRNSFVVVVVAFTLACGLALQWNGELLRAPALLWVNQAYVALGQLLKPDLFDAAVGSLPADMVLLPAAWLVAIIPGFESARVFTRYSIVGGFQLIVSALRMLNDIPRTIRWIIGTLLVVEAVPFQTVSMPVPQVGHPAHEWIRAQSLGAADAIIDLDVSPVRLGGDTIYSTRFHGSHTVSGVGSFMPAPTQALASLIGDRPERLALPDIALVLARFGVRYVLIHEKGGANGYEAEQWRHLQQNPYFGEHRCFEPRADDRVWPYVICVARVIPPSAFRFDAFRGDGWSAFENWGVWATGHRAAVEWIPLKRASHELILTLAPLCLADEPQSIVIRSNGIEIARHVWSNCDAWQTTVALPADSLNRGLNVIEFDASVVLKAGDKRMPNETRPLSFNVTQLQITSR